MDTFDNRIEGMKWGFRINQFISVFSTLFVLTMFLIVKYGKEYQKNDEKKSASNASANTSFEVKPFVLRCLDFF